MADAHRTRCRCGKLDMFAHEEGMPIVDDGGSETYSLILPQETVKDIFCPFCGGQGKGPWLARPRRCGCGSIQRWAAMAGSPIEFDTIGKDMYGLRCSGERIIGAAIWFCFKCGGRVSDRTELPWES